MTTIDVRYTTRNSNEGIVRIDLPVGLTDQDVVRAALAEALGMQPADVRPTGVYPVLDAERA